jgi:hypothetical protein
MSLRTAECSFHEVSEAGRQLAETGDLQAMKAFTRLILDCPRIGECANGDCCTILCASLLSDDAKPAGQE